MKKDDEKILWCMRIKRRKKCWVGMMLYNSRFEIHCNTRLVIIILVKAPAALSILYSDSKENRTKLNILRL